MLLKLGTIPSPGHNSLASLLVILLSDVATSDPIVAVESILLMYDMIRTSEYWEPSRRPGI